jgi:drug/metabolite transporter (DMT)-like permease
MGLTLVGVAWVIRERQPDATAADDARLRAGVAFGVLAAVCQAAGNVLTKLGAADASALAVSVVRLTAGGLGLGVQLAVAGRLLEAVRPLGDRVLAPRLIVGTFLGTYLGIWLMNAGLKGADVGVASTLNSTSPIFVLPLAVVLLGERVSLRAVVGAIVAVAGVAVLSLSGVGGG